MAKAFKLFGKSCTIISEGGGRERERKKPSQLEARNAGKISVLPKRESCGWYRATSYSHLPCFIMMFLTIISVLTGCNSAVHMVFGSSDLGLLWAHPVGRVQKPSWSRSAWGKELSDLGNLLSLVAPGKQQRAHDLDTLSIFWFMHSIHTHGTCTRRTWISNGRRSAKGVKNSPSISPPLHTYMGNGSDTEQV